jgi:hypothetical protein
MTNNKSDAGRTRRKLGRAPPAKRQHKIKAGGVLCRQETHMDQSMKMVIIAGVLMLALLIAVIGSVSADSVTWQSVASRPAPATQPL